MFFTNQTYKIIHNQLEYVYIQYEYQMIIFKVCEIELKFLNFIILYKLNTMPIYCLRLFLMQVQENRSLFKKNSMCQGS
jgi:hypothetical protein